MAQSLCKVYLHVVFHVKCTSPVILDEDLERVFAYISQMVKVTGCQVCCTGGVNNHVHVLCQLSRIETISHLVEEMKRNSSRWIKTISPYYKNFSWQGGYGAFSVSQSVVETTKKYIANQKEHHKKVRFEDEYVSFLKSYGIEYDEKYVFSD